MKELSDGGREERSQRWCPVHCVAEELLGGGWVAEDLSGGGREREEKRAGGGAWKNCQMVERRRGDGSGGGGGDGGAKEGKKQSGAGGWMAVARGQGVKAAAAPEMAHVARSLGDCTLALRI
jgi:hypothetical protein